MIRKLLLMMLLVCGVVAGVSAQGHGKKDRKQMWKEIKEFKIKFIAQEIELKDDQREQFVTLYNEMWDKRDNVMREAFRLDRKVKENKDATDTDYKAAADAMNKARTEDVALEKAYDEKFSQFLSPKQIYKMKAAEQEFRKKMEEMRHKRSKPKR